MDVCKCDFGIRTCKAQSEANSSTNLPRMCVGALTNRNHQKDGAGWMWVRVPNMGLDFGPYYDTESFYLCALMPWLCGYLSHRLLIPGQCSWLKTHNFIVRRVPPRSWIYVPIISYIHQLCLPTYGLKGAPCKTPNLIVIPWLQNADSNSKCGYCMATVATALSAP